MSGDNLKKEKYHFVFDMPAGFGYDDFFSGSMRTALLSTDEREGSGIYVTAVNSPTPLTFAAGGSHRLTQQRKSATEWLHLGERTDPANEIRYSFLLQRLIPGKEKMWLACEGSAENASAFDKLVKLCRSAKLK